MHYDPELTDDEWREENFSTAALHSASRLGFVGTPAALIQYAKKYGADGILESAIMLGQENYRKVEEAVAPRKRRRSS